MAGLDGVLNRTEPPDPVDKDLYDLPPEDWPGPQVPGPCRGPLALGGGQRFLQAGGVFTDDLIETWSSTSGSRDRPGPASPAPWEFAVLRHIECL